MGEQSECRESGCGESRGRGGSSGDACEWGMDHRIAWSADWTFYQGNMGGLVRLRSIIATNAAHGITNAKIMTCICMHRIHAVHFCKRDRPVQSGYGTRQEASGSFCRNSTRRRAHGLRACELRFTLYANPDQTPCGDRKGTLVNRTHRLNPSPPSHPPPTTTRHPSIPLSSPGA